VSADPVSRPGSTAPRTESLAEAPPQETWRDRFNRLADRATLALGSAMAVALSILLVVVWGLVGPLFNYSDSWQLFINTVTTVITFWMVFVIQNSQNRDARAIHLKLDEIIRATEKARNEFIVAEKATEAELDAHETELHELVDEVEDAHGVDLDSKAVDRRDDTAEDPVAKAPRPPQL
jgi:low affinity Fe/Cu permease